MSLFVLLLNRNGKAKAIFESPINGLVYAKVMLPI